MRSPLLLFLLSSVLVPFMLAEHSPRLTSCLSEEVLVKRVEKLQRSFRPSARLARRGAEERSCSEFSRTHLTAELRNRSLSPWRLQSISIPDMLPPTYEAAECLCSGCIINGKENTDYNSVPVEKTMMFLKKVPCPADPQKYSLEIEYKTIPVACTCVVPRL